MDYTATSLYGATPQAPSYGIDTPPTQAMGTGDIASGWRALVDPQNPLVWFGAILVLTVGLVGVAGSVRLAGAKVSGSIGQA